ncbi:hypothetical protein WJX72_005283 [[Myrmecia] bisecta]|uniref:Uncharacterized protein n=1 Tax=[Myrmecia] bisecta TaxID=41462 RepID=A0AAW1PAU4_9CHLO
MLSTALQWAPSPIAGKGRPFGTAEWYLLQAESLRCYTTLGQIEMEAPEDRDERLIYNLLAGLAAGAGMYAAGVVGGAAIYYLLHTLRDAHPASATGNITSALSTSQAAQASSDARVTSPADVGGEPVTLPAVSMTDQNGRKFSTDDLKNNYAVVYIGRADGPETAGQLDIMKQIVQQTDQKSGVGSLQPVFIAVDDTNPKKLRSALKDADARTRGLYGPEADEVRAMADELAKIVDDPDALTTTLVVVNPDGEVVHLFGTGGDIDRMSDAIARSSAGKR